MASANMSRGVSPGAALLRSSRMFSMPAPLSAPSDLSKATKHKSETATAPYPTHLTVTTPQPSRMLGDWGFKRPLPLKTTTKSTFPLVRVRQVDSMEHVTDFQSASDHTITLKKWQEMNISMSVPQFASRAGGAISVANGSMPPRSVFEEEDDVTALSPEDKVKKEKTRWKFSGPWLAGMTDGEFNHYLSDTVNGKRSEFRDYLKKELAAKMTEQQRSDAYEKAIPVPEPVQASEISEDALTEYLRELRHDRILLFQHVSRFLDLAPLAPESSYLAQLSAFNPYQRYNLSGNPYAVTGPPITHPSAGLSYLRTGNFLENHPIYGPQAQHTPVQARVVTPTNSFGGGYQAKIGVAGFITTIPEGNTTFNKDNSRRTRSGLDTFQPDVEGGSRIYVKPVTASVDASGKAVLRIVEADPMSSLVHREMVGDAKVYSEERRNWPNRELPPLRYRSRRLVTGQGQTVMGDKQSYGL